jgi:hypothetical protein
MHPMTAKAPCSYRKMTSELDVSGRNLDTVSAADTVARSVPRGIELLIGSDLSHRRNKDGRVVKRQPILRGER